MPIGRYLRETTRRQHLAWVEWLRQQRNVPGRTDWHLIRLLHAQLHPDSRPTLAELAVLFDEGPKKEAAEPFPRFTKETAARAMAEASKGLLLLGLGKRPAEIELN